jgi:1-phosphofructokinase family hexose kinase
VILTLTPNPSLDLLFGADRLVWDDANRLPTPRRRPGGQGVNLVRAVRALDPAAPTLAITPLGGSVGREMRDLLEAEGTPLRAVEVAGETRLFVGVRERETGRSLLLNPRGPRLAPAEGEALLEAVRVAMGDVASAAAGGWLVCCGSIPPGLPAAFYARAGVLARERGFRFVADCDCEALAAAAPLCDLLAPNAHEAGRLTGMDVTDPASALSAAAALHRAGAAVVAVTLGEAGAVGVSAEGSWWSRPEPPAELLGELEGSAVGAGDAFLAALLLELDGAAGVERALPRAVATGTATILSRGADLVLRPDVDRLIPHIVTERIH